MISFELNGDSKIIECGVKIPNIIGYSDMNGNIKKLKLKIYLNGKRCYKKIIVDENGWKFIRPLKLTSKDILTYTWSI